MPALVRNKIHAYLPGDVIPSSGNPELHGTWFYSMKRPVVKDGENVFDLTFEHYRTGQGEEVYLYSFLWQIERPGRVD